MEGESVRGFWLDWIGACAAGGAFEVLLWSILPRSVGYRPIDLFLPSAIRGASLGFFQWIVLRGVSRRLGWWPWATVAGVLLARLARMGFETPFPVEPRPDFQQVDIRSLLATYAIQGGVIGLCQFLALRRSSPRAFWWPFISAISYLLVRTFLVGLRPSDGEWVAIETVMGILVGAALAFWILRPARRSCQIPPSGPGAGP